MKFGGARAAFGLFVAVLVVIPLAAPQFWNRDGTRTRFGHVEEIPADEPVQHVTYFEAEAYAAWAGRELPTEWFLQDIRD